MGQTESLMRGSSTFAYSIATIDTNTTSTRSSSKTHKKSDPSKNDPILNHPELYGLKSQQYPFSPLLFSSPCNSMTSLDSLDYNDQRADSGYMSPSYDESMQLATDLAYVDNTYYSTTTTVTDVVVSDTDKEEDGLCADRQSAISFTDIMLSSPDKSLREVYLSCRSIYKLSPNMGMLTMVRKLDLSNNHLTELPEAIGYMKSLIALSVAKNRLKSLPDTIGYLSNLIELDASYNQLESLTPCIGYLGKLKTLSVAYNQISRIPTDISGLQSLISLNLTRNPLRVLPAEVSKLPFLRKMQLEDCPFDVDISYPLKHNAPSLVEICARTVMREQIDIDNHPYLPEHMVHYIKSAKSCTSCHGPYYESYVLRGRLMEKPEMQIPLEYTLCSAHWSDADDRILSMFSAQPETSSQVHHLPSRPMLPRPSKHSKDKLSALARRSRHPSANTSGLDVDQQVEDQARLAPAASKFHMESTGKSSVAKLTSKLRKSTLSW